jgi:hypothetical protein
VVERQRETERRGLAWVRRGLGGGEFGGDGDSKSGAAGRGAELERMGRGRAVKWRGWRDAADR